MRYHVLLSLVLPLAACSPAETPVAPKCPQDVATAPPKAAPDDAAPAASVKKSPPLDIELTPYAFLLGDWEPLNGESGIGPFSFESDVQGRVIHRTNHTPVDAGGHEDLLTMYLTQQGDVRALHMDKSGRVLEYAVSTSDKPKTVVLVSNEIAGQRRYRITYELKDDGMLLTTLQMTQVGKSEFSGYLAWTAKKK